MDQKGSVFRFRCSERFADFTCFCIRFSVFTKTDAVFGFSFLTPLIKGENVAVLSGFHVVFGLAAYFCRIFGFPEAPMPSSESQLTCDPFAAHATLHHTSRKWACLSPRPLPLGLVSLESLLLLQMVKLKGKSQEITIIKKDNFIEAVDSLVHKGQRNRREQAGDRGEKRREKGNLLRKERERTTLIQRSAVFCDERGSQE